ncbi:MAG: hypothetical protein AAF328_12045 [Planctomycetota bacterium]
MTVGTLGLGVLLPGFAVGLDIDPVYRTPLSNEPSTDIGGSRLSAIVDAAKNYYEDRIGDGHQLDVQFYYFDFGPTSNLGATTLRTESGGRVTEVFLRVAKNPLGSSGNWYYDSQPQDSSEYGMSVTRVGDLSSAQRSDGFRGDVPDTLEVGHTGWGSGNAAGKVDLYTVVLHELGHALGMLSTASGAQNEAADGDYDFRTDQIGGRSVAVKTISGTANHLRPSSTLMWDNYQPGQRRLPSATDLLSIAKVSDFTQLDLERKSFAAGNGTHDWTGLNWIGGRNPGSSEDAFIGSRDHNPTVRLIGNASVQNLDVRYGDTLDLNGRRLTLGNDLDLFDGGTTLKVRGGGAVLDVDDLRNQSGTTTELRDGGRIEADTWELDGGATARLGAGTARITTRWTNDGTARNDFGGVVTFEAVSGNTTWDLDGNGNNGRIDATSGDVRFVGGRWAGDLQGTIAISAGRTFTGQGELTVGNGRVELNGSGSQAARLDGGNLTVNGGTLRLAGQAELGDDLRVNWGTLEVAGSAELDVRDDVRWFGGNVSGGDLHLTAGDMLDLGNGTSITLASLEAPNLEVAGSGTGSASLAWTGAGAASGTTVNVDLAGPGQHDTLIHAGGSGAAWRNATLALRTAYTPDIGDRITLIEGLNDAAELASLEGAWLASDLRWAVVQDGDELAAVAARPGDLDLDGDVDFGDAMRFAASFRALDAAGSASSLGSGLTWVQGDFDADRDVDLDDALALANTYGGVVGNASASAVWLAPALGYAEDSPQAAYLASGGAVPEPGAGAAALLGWMGVTLRRRARRV